MRTKRQSHNHTCGGSLPAQRNTPKGREPSSPREPGKGGHVGEKAAEAWPGAACQSEQAEEGRRGAQHGAGRGTPPGAAVSWYYSCRVGAGEGQQEARGWSAIWGSWGLSSSFWPHQKRRASVKHTDHLSTHIQLSIIITHPDCLESQTQKRQNKDIIKRSLHVHSPNRRGNEAPKLHFGSQNPGCLGSDLMPFVQKELTYRHLFPPSLR